MTPKRYTPRRTSAKPQVNKRALHHFYAEARDGGGTGSALYYCKFPAWENRQGGKEVGVSHYHHLVAIAVGTAVGTAVGSTEGVGLKSSTGAN